MERGPVQCVREAGLCVRPGTAEDRFKRCTAKPPVCVLGAGSAWQAAQESGAGHVRWLGSPWRQPAASWWLVAGSWQPGTR